MKSFSILIICSLLVIGSWAQTDLQLIETFGSEILSFITNGTLEHFIGCKAYDNFTENAIKYYLYNRTTDVPITLTLDNLGELNNTKDTKILFHGWGQSAQAEEILDLVKAYISRYDCNVIAVDYSNISNTHYSQAYCNIQKGAEFIANFFCQVQSKGYLNFDHVHMVGFSLGGEIIGLIGQKVQQKCNQKIDRLTGLDPAGPIFQNQNISMRLDKSDAKFVDVIHSNMGLFGYYGSIGHVDFYPNCGTVQPGCIQINKFPDLISIIFNLVICSHTRSLLYFTESVYGVGPVFNSTSCSRCPNSEGVGKCTGPDIINPKYAIMGEDCPRNPPAEKFTLKTNSKSPYAQG